MACCLRCPKPASITGGAGAPPDHPISGHSDEVAMTGKRLLDLVQPCLLTFEQGCRFPVRCHVPLWG